MLRQQATDHDRERFAALLQQAKRDESAGTPPRAPRSIERTLASHDAYIAQGHDSMSVTTSHAALLQPASLDPVGPDRFFEVVDGDDESVERRKFLALASLVAASSGLQINVVSTALEALRHGISYTLTDRLAAVAIDEWHEIAMEYGQTYLTAAPAEVLGSLIVDLHALHSMLRSCSDDAVQRELRQAGSLLAAFTAQTVANLGDLRGARRWWRTARRVADESGDQYAMLWSRGREITRAGYENRPLTTVVELIDEAEARADRAPAAVLPEFICGKAQALALIGDKREAIRSLQEAHTAFAALPSSVTRSSADSLLAWGEERLRFAESFVYSHLGDYAKAASAQAAALKLYPDDDARGPAQIELQRALCLVRSGDLEQGTRHAQAVLSQVPSMHAVRPIADLGHKVLKSVPARYLHNAGVAEYREFLASLSRGPQLSRRQQQDRR
jgi:tetratricopeptide (TPR) repeat protein